MNRYFIPKSGWVVSWKGLYWGKIYEGGNYQVDGWTHIDNAHMSLRKIDRPEDLSTKKDKYVLSELKKGTVKYVDVETVYWVKEA